MKADSMSASNRSNKSAKLAVSPLDAAVAKLRGSVEHLNAAVDHRLQMDVGHDELRAAYNKLNDDRKHLSARVDQAEGRNQAISQVSQDVSNRLSQAMETIKNVLESQAKK